jgi:hypothetical protein
MIGGDGEAFRVVPVIVKFFQVVVDRRSNGTEVFSFGPEGMKIVPHIPDFPDQFVGIDGQERRNVVIGSVSSGYGLEILVLGK